MTEWGTYLDCKECGAYKGRRCIDHTNCKTKEPCASRIKWIPRFKDVCHCGNAYLRGEGIIECKRCQLKPVIDEVKEKRELIQERKRGTSILRIPKRNCEECGIEYQPEHPNMKYCGAKCRNKNRYRRLYSRSQ